MIWNNALKLLENDVTKPTFDTWFKSTELAAYYGEKRHHKSTKRFRQK